MVLTNGKVWVQKKILIINKDTNMNNLTLEQVGILSAIPKTIDGDTEIKYFGITDNKDEAEVFKFKTKAKKALKIVKDMYGKDFYIE